jgi:hypothetical protein
MGGELPAPAVHHVQVLVAVVVVIRVGVSSEDALKDPLRGLITEVPFSRGRVTFITLLLSRPTMRRRAILGGLLAQLKDLAAFRGVVATVGVDRA